MKTSSPTAPPFAPVVNRPRRDVLVNFKLTRDERTILAETARRAGVTVAEYVRQAIRVAMSSRAPTRR